MKVKRLSAYGLFNKRRRAAIQANTDVPEGGDFSVAAWRSSTCTAFNALDAVAREELAREAEEVNRKAEESARKAIEDKWGPGDEEERARYVALKFLFNYTLFQHYCQARVANSTTHSRLLDGVFP